MRQLLFLLIGILIKYAQLGALWNAGTASHQAALHTFGIFRAKPAIMQAEISG